MEDKTILILAALISIVIIELYALSQGINGQMLAFVLMLIGGLVGYSAPPVVAKLKK